MNKNNKLLLIIGKLQPNKEEYMATSNTHPLVDISELELHESCAYGGDVTLLVGKGHPACSLGVLQFRVGVDPRVTNPPVQSFHGQREFSFRNAENKK